jgi:uncharacterized protein
MPFDDLLGKTTKLEIKRFGPPGAFLDVSAFDKPDATVLLIGSEIPEGAAVGDAVEVFVHLDSEARPIATTRTSKLQRGQVTFLEVTAKTGFGSFVDWGLAKELLVPFAEQTTEMELGSRHPIGVLLDATQRLIGTMRVAEILKQNRAEVTAGSWLEGEAWRNEPETGLFVILEKSFVGMVPASEPHTLSRGQQARFRVSRVLADGKLELSLRAPAHEESANDAAKLLAFLQREDAPKVGDKSDPEELRSLFGFSKKAFKRAAGNLLKQGVASIDDAGFLRLKPR